MRTLKWNEHFLIYGKRCYYILSSSLQWLPWSKWIRRGESLSVYVLHKILFLSSYRNLKLQYHSANTFRIVSLHCNISSQIKTNISLGDIGIQAKEGLLSITSRHIFVLETWTRWANHPCPQSHLSEPFKYWAPSGAVLPSHVIQKEPYANRYIVNGNDSLTLG